VEEMPSDEVKLIEKEIEHLEADILTLKNSLTDWDHDSQNIHGAKKYNGEAKRIVLQAQKLAELIKEKAFSR
jgi:prefoldin subunit 5